MPAMTGYYDTLKSVAGKVFSYLASITLTGTDGKILTVTQDTSLDEAVAMSSKAPKESPVFTTQITAPIIYGGSGANGDVTIEGTSHGTKTTSYVILQPTGGKVSIGTPTPPGAMLEVKTRTDGRFQVADGGTQADGVVIGVLNDADNDYKPLEFYTSKTLFTAGNVGILIATPANALEINGGLTVGDSTVAGDNNVYVVGDVSALTFTDRTPYYDGDALADLKKIKGKDGHIDHDSLPAFARSNIPVKQKKTTSTRIVIPKEQAFEDYEADESTTEVLEEKTEYALEGETVVQKTKPVFRVEKKLKRRLMKDISFDTATGEFYKTVTVEEMKDLPAREGRNLGAMISILIEAVKQLSAELELLKSR